MVHSSNSIIKEIEKKKKKKIKVAFHKTITIAPILNKIKRKRD